ALAQRQRDLALSLEKQAKAFVDPAVRDLEMRTLLADSLPIFNLTWKRMNQLAGEIRGILEKDNSLYSGWGDTVSQIHVAWEQAEIDWLKIIEADAKDCSRQLESVISSLDSAIYNCCVITVPGRITEHLTLLPIGGTLNFRDAYSDELATAAARQKFLS